MTAAANSHDRAARVAAGLLLAIDAGEVDVWADFGADLAALDLEALVPLAFVALAALPAGILIEVVDQAAIGAGCPLPPFVALAEEARGWADRASAAEVKFYAWACVERLSPADRRALAARIAKMGGRAA